MTERLLEAEVAGVGDEGLEVGVAQEVLTNSTTPVIAVIDIALEFLTIAPLMSLLSLLSSLSSLFPWRSCQ